MLFEPFEALATAESDSDRAVRWGVSCVAENRSDWSRKVRNLVLSVRAGESSLANAPIVVNVVGGLNERIWRPIRELDAELRVVEPFDSRFPHANKLRMLENDQLLSAVDVLLAVDCDVILASEPTEIFQLDAVCAKPEDQTILSDEHWHLIYQHMGIDPPSKDCRLTSSGELSYPWWNSGVVGIPVMLADRLRQRWASNVPLVGELVEAGELPANWITDQVAFACALLMDGIPFHELPVIANFPVPYSVNPDIRNSCPGPAIFVHFHHSISAEGFIEECGDATVDAQIHSFNELLATHTGVEAPSRSCSPKSLHILERAGKKLQRRLAKQPWYKSPRLRPLKKLIVNFSDFCQSVLQRGVQ